MFDIYFLYHQEDLEEASIYKVDYESTKNLFNWYLNQSISITINAKNGTFVVPEYSVKSIRIERIG